MKLLLPEVDNNARAFAERFPSEIARACEKGLESSDGFRDSYRRVVSLQAWRDRHFEQMPSDSVSALFLEAQNDALLSLVLAHTAMWRPALQSLRSCIENILNTCYYVDHPVEFQLWQNGNHRNSFSGLTRYFSEHPDVADYNRSSRHSPNVIAQIQSEYSALSKAVHASSKQFYMTKGGSTVITHPNISDYNQWNKRHCETLLWMNFLLVILNASVLQGAQNTDLRKSISLAIPVSHHDAIVQHLSVHLFPLEE